MKRFLLLLVPMSLVVSSCGLLNMAVNNGAVSQAGNPLASAVSVVAPNPNHLKATEDRGTGLYGYLNEFGMWAIAPTYSYAKDFNCDLGLATVQLQGGRWGAIDVLGQTVIQFNFDSSYEVDSAMRSIIKGRYQGIDLWAMEDRGTGLWGYLDFYGNWYITPQFKYACSMSDEGFAVVQFSDGLWGAIDRSCRIIVQPNFTSRYDVDSALRTILRR